MRHAEPESRPNPDPSTLTTAQLLREVEHRKDALNALKEIFETRLREMDKALVLLQAFADKSPTTAAVDQSVKELSKLTDEKFRSVETLFKERDARTEQTAKDSKIAVDAAFAAAKEAVAEQNKSNAASIAKSEAAFTKQIDVIGVLLTANNKTSDEKFTDIKDRITLIEGRSTGHGDVWGYIIGAAGLIVAALAVIAFFAKRII